MSFRTMTRHPLTIAATLALASGCASNVSPEAEGLQSGATVSRALDPNDLSVLLPIFTARDVDALQGLGSDLDSTSEFLPRAMYEDIARVVPQFNKPDLVTDPAADKISHFSPSDYSTYKIVAFRFLPCGGDTPPQSAADCIPMIRLVAQPVVGGSGVEPFVHDAAIHLAYALAPREATPGSKEAVIRKCASELQAIKAIGSNATQFRPLAPHPVLAQSGVPGPVFDAMRAFLTKHVVQQHLLAVSITTAQTRTEDEQLVSDAVWTFATFVPSGQPAHLHLAPLPFAHTGGGGETRVSLSTKLDLQANETRALASSPSSRSADTLSFFERLLSAPSRRVATKAELSAMVDKIVAIENPVRHEVGTIDCASCHLTTNARASADAFVVPKLGLAALPESQGAYARGPLAARAKDSKDTTVWAIRNFGYSAFIPVAKGVAISDRVVQETLFARVIANDVAAGRTLDDALTHARRGGV